MGVASDVVREICFRYVDLIDGCPEEEYDVRIREHADGSVSCMLDDKPAILSLEALAAWSFTLNNWKTRIKKDVVFPQNIDD